MATIDATATAAGRAPGPKGLPLLGSITDLRRDQYAFMLRMALDYGDVARFRLGPVQFNLVSNPDGVGYVLQEHNRNYVKGANWAPVRQLVGAGLFGSDGAPWLRRRRLLQPTFHRRRISTFADLMVRSTEDMLARWDHHAGTGEPIDLGRELTTLTMRIIAASMFHTSLDDELPALSASISWLLADLDFRMGVPIYPGIGVPTPRNLRTRRELAAVDAVIHRIIRSRRQAGAEVPDLLGMLMEARDEETGEPLTDAQLRDELVTFFVAGHETTALLLTWLFHLLASNPAWDSRLFREATDVLGDRAAGADDVGRLVLTRMAIDETLRLYPPAWITSRTAVSDDTVCGYRIGRGEVVGISPYALHRLPALWPDPERFDPMRFAPEQVAARPRFAYVPFGGGPHQCIGNGFALLEAQLVVATIIRRYRLAAVDPGPVELAASTTLRPRRPIRMALERRAGSGSAADPAVIDQPG